MKFVPSEIAIWSVAAGTLGLLTHAHDIALGWASATMRPRGVVDWAVSTLGFSCTFAKWNLGGLLLWAICNEPALHWFAIGRAAVSMVVWR